jgi:hypothetical protein
MLSPSTSTWNADDGIAICRAQDNSGASGCARRSQRWKRRRAELQIKVNFQIIDIRRYTESLLRKGNYLETIFNPGPVQMASAK